MNGLTYIRLRCNLSQTFLSQKLGVTRQAINLWESRTAPPPAKRLKQLTEFLGIDAKYFGEITEEQCREIDAIPAYRHEEDGRTYFCYVAHPEFCRDPDMKRFLVPPDSDVSAPLISFDERYQIVRQEMRELLEAIDGLTETSRHPMGTIERIAATNRTRHIFAPLVESVRGYVLDETISPAHRMIYYYLLLEVMTSIGLVFGTIARRICHRRSRGIRWAT